LIPEDAPNPLVVAPSSPLYSTLESFRSDAGTLSYRYRLTATSRVTGLSSHSEVELHVFSRRPSVYCPLEIEVAEGSSAVLSCEGADPLSFRLEGESGVSSRWSWEGLWGSSAELLEGADTSSPLFRAPSGSAGRTYHYVASLTTAASGAPRTARRKVSVTVKEREDVSAPEIACSDSPYEVYEGEADITIACEAQDAPDGATYQWTGPDVPNRLTVTDGLTTTFVVPQDIPGGGIVIGFDYTYTVTMFDGDVPVTSGAGGETAPVKAEAVVTVKERPNIRNCINSSNREVDEGGGAIKLGGCLGGPIGAPGDNPVYRYQWRIRAGAPTPGNALSLLSRTDVYEPYFTPPDDVQRNTLYEYELIISADNADPFTFRAEVTVNDLNAGNFSLACETSAFSVFAGADDITLACKAPAAPSDAVWKWTHRSPTENADRLSPTDVASPTFDVPDASLRESTIFYYNVSVRAGSKSQDQNVTVEVIRLRTLLISCESGATFLEGDNDGTVGDCEFVYGGRPADPGDFTSAWKRGSTTDARFEDATPAEFLRATLSATNIHAPYFYVPDNVNKHEKYTYVRELSWIALRRRVALERNVVVRVLDRDSFDATLDLACTDPDPVYEGSADITLSCAPSGVPAGRTPSYKWEAASGLILARLISGRTTATPTFRAPASVDEDMTYEYRATVTAKNTLPGSDMVTVKVLDKPDIAVSCADNPYSAYEGSGNLTLSCAADGAPGDDPDYAYAWEARGVTADTDRLIADTNGPKPTFDVPEEVDGSETYEYRLTVTAPNAEPASANVTVKVLDKPAIAVTCTDPEPAYEGAGVIRLNCSNPTGAPSGSSYSYAWEAR